MTVSASTQHLMSCVRQLVKPALYVSVIKGFFGIGLALSQPAEMPIQPPVAPLITTISVKRVQLREIDARGVNLVTSSLSMPPVLPPRPRSDSPSPVKPVPARRPSKPAAGFCPFLVTPSGMIMLCRVGTGTV